ncbi:MAG: hypothetical protein M1826_004816 [Phylliscum demangeonii]|nr:MAG: hypothetical protein M1826_004816 [Phylliscum demangeonii]
MFSWLSSSSRIPSLKEEARATDDGGSSSSMPVPTPIADQPQPGLHTMHYPRPSRPTRVSSPSSSNGSVYFDPEETRASAAIELDPIGPPSLPPMPARPRPVHVANGRRAAAATCPARILHGMDIMTPLNADQAGLLEEIERLPPEIRDLIKRVAEREVKRIFDQGEYEVSVTIPHRSTNGHIIPRKTYPDIHLGPWSADEFGKFLQLAMLEKYQEYHDSEVMYRKQPYSVFVSDPYYRASILDLQPHVNRFRTRPLAGWHGWYDRYGNPLPPNSLSTHSASSVAWALRENSWDDSCPRPSHVEPVDPSSVPRPLKESAKRQHDFEDWLESIVEEAREWRDEHPGPTTEGFKRRIRGHWHTFTDKIRELYHEVRHLPYNQTFRWIWGRVFSTWCKNFLSNFFASGCCAPCCNIGLSMLFGLCQCGVGGHPNY